jgi:hypothetical protein
MCNVFVILYKIIGHVKVFFMFILYTYFIYAVDLELSTIDDNELTYLPYIKIE